MCKTSNTSNTSHTGHTTRASATVDGQKLEVGFITSEVIPLAPGLTLAVKGPLAGIFRLGFGV